MDQPDDEAWLLDLAARIDDGRPIDWARVEAAAGPEALDVVRALQVLETVAIRGRHQALAIESAAVTAQPPFEPPPAAQTPGAPPPSEDGPVSDRYRSIAPSSPEEIRRKLLFFAALLLSLASVLVGLVLQIPVLQFTLVGLAVLAVVVALMTGTPPPAPPTAGSPDGPPRA